MENMIAFLVGFPFVSALLLAVFKNNTARKIITYISSAAIIITALSFALTYFTGGNDQVTFLERGQLFGIGIVEIVDYAIIAIESFFVILITVLSIKYKKYYAAALSIAQTALIFWYEFSGNKPEQSTHNLYIDQLTVIMIVIIAVVGTLITVYACGYMKDYHNHHTEFKDRRCFFFAIMYVFLGAMFGLVLSNNIIWMYFFWEITSVCSFLLIGYTKTEEAINNCFRALWMNLLGGCGFAAGIVWAGMDSNVRAVDLQSLISVKGEFVIVPVIFLAFAALTKSAQLPFSKWLLGAMVAPTPSSALLHSATMVKAGVYLLIRLAPVMHGQYGGYLVSFIGGFTFLIMSMLAITVSDGKKVLAYSTLSNLGLITACAGIGTAETVWAATFLLVFHAVSKALLFQTVGSIEHQTGSRDIESMHGLVKRYPNLSWTLVVGIAGMYLAPFGMLISKWTALKSFIDNSSILLVLCICFGSATTLLYWSKWLATILSSNPTDKEQKNKISADQWISLTIHSVLMVFLCFAFPVISSHVIIPYLRHIPFAQLVDSSFSVIGNVNIVTMIIMLTLIFVIPVIVYFTSVETNRYQLANRYFNGISNEEQDGFTDSFGKTKKMVLSNWYLEDIFGEGILYKPCVIISIAAIVICAAVSIIGGVL